MKPWRFLSTDVEIETSESDEILKLECSFADYGVPQLIPSATPHSPLSSSPYNRDLLPIHLGELTDSSRIPTSTGVDELPDYVVLAVRQVRICLKRFKCELNFLTAERRKRHAEGVKIAVSCADFRSPLESQVELMQLESKLQDSDTRSKLVNCHY
ncbi:hypothetical protein EG68_06461 [Paragonimus skrjabini miyazakii]|uniref:Uncharacterized protein n=1 Tax=Paragonimus skrjabini miyazakii TaxID=59628 RepID=A0A8S9YUI9_9TREM|nr:hypothetical protein EG68_06461 [Paragonimus skrjabini miyazakii]